jgi:hypothetical protein
LGRRDCDLGDLVRRQLTAEFRKPLREFADDFVGVQSNRFGVRTHERAAENAGGPPRDIVAFEGFEERAADLGVVRDRFQGDLATLAFEPQAGTEG